MCPIQLNHKLISPNPKSRVPPPPPSEIARRGGIHVEILSNNILRGIAGFSFSNAVPCQIDLYDASPRSWGDIDTCIAPAQFSLTSHCLHPAVAVGAQWHHRAHLSISAHAPASPCDSVERHINICLCVRACCHQQDTGLPVVTYALPRKEDGNSRHRSHHGVSEAIQVQGSTPWSKIRIPMKNNRMDNLLLIPSPKLLQAGCKKVIHQYASFNGNQHTNVSLSKMPLKSESIYWIRYLMIVCSMKLWVVTRIILVFHSSPCVWSALVYYTIEHSPCAT